MTPQEAYVELSKMLEETQLIKDQVDAKLVEMMKFARHHKLVFEQRYKDALPEVLDPSTYKEETIVEKDWKGRDREHIQRTFIVDLPDAYCEAGDPVDCWMPSELC